MSNAITLDKGFNLKVVIYPPSKANTLDDFGDDVDVANGVDITPMVQGFRYYESLNQIFLQAELEIFDATNQIKNIFNSIGDKCGIRKYCIIDVVFPDPLTTTDSSVVSNNVQNNLRNTDFLFFSQKNSFYISKISDQYVQNTKTYYKIELINKKLFLNLHKKVVKAYSGNISDIVARVSKEELLSEITISSEEKAAPINKYLAQRISPSDIIEFACRKSEWLNEKVNNKQVNTADNNVDIQKKSVGYFFYEIYKQDGNGLQFRPIYKLLKPDPKDLNIVFNYEYSPLSPSEAEDNAPYKVYSMSYNRGTSNILEDANTGTIGKSVNRNRDPVTGTVRVTTETIEVIKNPCDSYNFESASESVVKSIKIQEYNTQFVNECDPGNVSVTPILRKNYDALLEYIRNRSVDVLVPGNLSLRVGNYITIAQAGTAAAENDPNKQSIIKTYLIVDLCHRVTDINRVYTDLKLCEIVPDGVSFQ